MVTGIEPKCFEGCPQICSPLSDLVTEYMNHMDSFDADAMKKKVCDSRDNFACMYTPAVLTPCAKVLAQGKQLGIVLPSTAVDLQAQCTALFGPSLQPDVSPAQPQASGANASAEAANASGPASPSTPPQQQGTPSSPAQQQESPSTPPQQQESPSGLRQQQDRGSGSVARDYNGGSSDSDAADDATAVGRLSIFVGLSAAIVPLYL